MIQDAQLIFSDAQVLTASADSTNDLDMKVTDPNLGSGKQKMIDVRVGTVLDSSGDAAVLTITLEHSSDDSTYVTLAVSRAIPEAELVEGFVAWQIALPPKHRRYLRLAYGVTTENFTSGTMDASITTGPSTR